MACCAKKKPNVPTVDQPDVSQQQRDAEERLQEEKRKKDEAETVESARKIKEQHKMEELAQQKQMEEVAARQMKEQKRMEELAHQKEIEEDALRERQKKKDKDDASAAAASAAAAAAAAAAATAASKNKSLQEDEKEPLLEERAYAEPNKDKKKKKGLLALLCCFCCLLLLLLLLLCYFYCGVDDEKHGYGGAEGVESGEDGLAGSIGANAAAGHGGNGGEGGKGGNAEAHAAGSRSHAGGEMAEQQSGGGADNGGGAGGKAGSGGAGGAGESSGGGAGGADSVWCWMGISSCPEGSTSSSMSSNVPPEVGVIGIKSFMQPDEGFYSESKEVSDKSGRKEYIGIDNNCKIAYQNDDAYWSILCDGKERCKSYFTSAVPPTDGWECVDGEMAPIMDLLKSILHTTNTPGESRSKGDYGVAGTRGGKDLFENGDACQVSFSKSTNAWENLCYTDETGAWASVYCNADPSDTPPVSGWISKNGGKTEGGCNPVGEEPAPEFEFYDLRGKWANGATSGEFSSTNDKSGSSESEREKVDEAAGKIDVPSDFGNSGEAETIAVEAGDSASQHMSTELSTPLTAKGGQICVSGEENSPMVGCFDEVTSSLKYGRYSYKNEKTKSAIEYNSDDSYWAMMHDGKELCKSMLTSFFPPTRDWECVSGESPRFDVGKSIIEVETASFKGDEFLTSGTSFVEQGVRDGKPMYESNNGCQVSYDSDGSKRDKAKAWKLMCYVADNQLWKVLYVNSKAENLPPLNAWYSDCGTYGPTFIYKDLESDDYVKKISQRVLTESLFV